MNAASPNAQLGAALAEAVASYRARNPRSERQFNSATEVMPGGNTRSVLFNDPFPLTMLRGEDCWLWDADGHRYLDALGEFTAGLYGHSHPVIREALHAALADGLSLSSHTVCEAALAREIRGRFTSMELLRFTNSGTEANLLALAVAKVHTGRRKVLVFEGAYHGGVLAFGGGNSPVNVPHEFVLAPYNDLDAARAIVARDGAALAAVLVEPMLGSGGCIPGEPAFLRGLEELAGACGALFVLDEVMTSRLSIGGRQALLGLKPDLTTLGKYFGGGLSFGAFGGRADVMARFDPRRPDALAHAGTFNNNVLTCAAGLAGLQRVLTPGALETLNARGERLRDRINDVFATQGVAMQFSGLGSLMNLHATRRPLRRPADLAGSDSRAKDLLYYALLERGVFMARRGFVALSLPFGDPQVETLVAALEDCVRATRAHLPAAGAA
ncbi:MAG: aminotransferase class III-fold pyridoxal phosphate-dependent enzyme [Burkholderiaceae bacterium]